MKWLNGYRIRFVLVAFVAVFLAAAVFGQSAINSDTEVVITIAGQEHRYQPRPELGYIVKSQDNAAAIVGAYEDIRLFTQAPVRPMGGRDRRGLWIVESRRPDSQNQAVIKSIRAQRYVQYAAPLFSYNDQTVAIIPEIVVRVTSGTQSEEFGELCRKLNLRIKRRLMFTEQEYLVDVSGVNAEAVLNALIELNQIELVEWAAPNIVSQRKRPEIGVSNIDDSTRQGYLYSAQQTTHTSGFIPNDEYFPYQWHLHNTGQFGGTLDADINAPEAWEITAGDPNIVVVVHDVGVDSNHPDLVNNLVPGYDFYDDDNLPEPAAGEAHGTMCAGVVAAEGNNNIGVVGVAWKCKVMPIRAFTYDYFSVADAAEAIRWSAASGADVMSYSWGLPNPQPIIYSAVVDITKPGGIGRDGKGCVVFAAAANDGSRLRYPAANPEVIAVGATDCNDQRWSYSNYGPELDIVAPGGELWDLAPGGKAWPKEGNAIWTTDITGLPGMSSHPKNPFPDILDYIMLGGTSSSCPVAAGVAALILSVEPNLTNEEVRHFLTRSAKDLGDPGRDDYYGWGRVDARAALDMVLAKRADLNNDWKVDLEDLLVLIEFWGATETSVDIAPATRRDGIVDEQDLDLMMRYWQTEIPELGLIAHWRLDETEGDITKDSAGQHDGTLNGDPQWQPLEGRVAGALELDRVDDYVETDFVLNPADGEFSVFVWIKGGAPGQAVLSQIGGVNWLCADTLEGNLMTELKATSRGAAAMLSQTVITDGNWHRIALVWDGSQRILYVDDVEVAIDTQANLEGSVGGLYIGVGKALDPVTFWTGLIDDVRIYGRAISP